MPCYSHEGFIYNSTRWLKRNVGMRSWSANFKEKRDSLPPFKMAFFHNRFLSDHACMLRILWIHNSTTVSYLSYVLINRDPYIWNTIKGSSHKAAMFKARDNLKAWPAALIITWTPTPRKKSAHVRWVMSWVTSKYPFALAPRAWTMRSGMRSLWKFAIFSTRW
jgi:hypothetical protein